MRASARSLNAVFLVLLAVLLAGCGESPTAPSHYADYSQTDLVVGTGAEAVNGSSVTVTYTGWFYDPSKPNQKGVIFDTSTGRDAFTFTLGGGTIIEGWERGLPGMKVGGTRRLVIPPSLAYGARRQGLIPPYSTLLFEVTLVAVK